MTHLTDDRLVDIALGSPGDVLETEHLSTCADCAAVRDGVADTISLTRAGESAELVDPPDRVWEAIRAEIWAEESAPAPEAAPPGVTSLSDRREQRERRRTGRPMTWLLAAACVLGIVLGVGGATLAGRLGTAPEPTETTVATVELTPLDSPDRQGSAALVDRDDGLNLSVSTTGLDPGDGYLEVWLINRDLTRMISVGVLPADATTILLPVSQDLIDEGYVIVDISREPFDDQPAHSGKTLVRGELVV